MNRARARAICIAGSLVSPFAVAGTYVAPRPGGGDDTAALQAALDACVPGGPGCTIRLARGTYHTAQLFVSGFRGSVVGAGAGVTIIEALPALTVSAENGLPDGYNSGGIFSTPPSPTNPYPYLITVAGASDIAASRFTVRIPHAPATTLWYYGYDTPSDFMKAAFYVSGSGRFRDMAFEGSPDAINFDNAVLMESGEVLEFKSNRVRANCSNGLEVYGAVGTRITVGGSPAEGNLFEGSSGAGIFIALDGVTLEHSWNTTRGTGCGWLGVWVTNAPSFGPLPANPSRVTIAANHLAGIDDAVPILVNDGWFNPRNGGTKTLDLAVVGNELAATGAISAGLWMVWTSGPLVAANRISGTGCVGMFAGNAAQGNVLLNDLGSFVATAGDGCGFGGEAPSILLNVRAHDTTVAWNHAPQGVVDWGTNDVVTNNR